MCGIAGHFNGGLTSEQLEGMGIALQHRGPDGAGIYYDVVDGVGLVHRRLSIIDLSADAAQPFLFENLITIYNGEIYNFAEIRKELELKGYLFQTSSDTEVLIKAFHCWGEKSVEHFIGMFAFAIFDKSTKEFFLFRDRLGVKPLYYSTEQGLVFASEINALRTLNRNEQLDDHSLYHYFRFGYVPGDASIFKQIKKLKAGHYLHVKHGKINIHPYWTVTVQNPPSEKSEEQWANELEELLISSFRYRMVADVPVGVFLSGGIDSSLVASILQKHFGTISTLTIGFKEKRFNEAPYAKEVAERLGTNHIEQIIEKEDARKELARFYNIYDEPFADTSGIPVSLISALAKSNGIKVVLSADGGDELFGGYPHYLRINSAYKKMHLIPGFLRSGMTTATRGIIPKGIRGRLTSFNLEHRIYAYEELLNSKTAIDFYESTIANQSHSEIEKLMNGYSAGVVSNPDNGSELTSFMNWDLHNYLPEDLLVKVDRATMCHGVEGREPFLDHRLVEFAASLPLSMKFRNGEGKYLLKKVLGRYLPSSLFDRPKRGFSIPIFDWFSADLDSLFSHYLNPQTIRKDSVLNPAEVQHEFSKYIYNKKRGKEYNIEKMWRILSFMMWQEKHG